MGIFKKKYNVKVIGEDWVVIEDKLKMEIIPRKGEFIIFKNELPYYQVVSVIHTHYKGKTDIIIVIKEVVIEKK